MQTFTTQKTTIEAYKVSSCSPQSLSQSRDKTIWNFLDDFLRKIFLKNNPKSKESTRSPCIHKIKPILSYRFDIPEHLVTRYLKTKTIQFDLTKTKLLPKFKKNTRKCFKGSSKIQFLHDKVRPTYLSIEEIPLQNLTKIDWTFIRRHSMTSPILEKEFTQIIKCLKKAIRLRDLSLEFSGGYDVGKPNYATLFTKSPFNIILNQMVPLESLTLCFKHSSGIFFSIQAFEQMMETISFLRCLKNLALEIEINSGDKEQPYDQSIFSKSLQSLLKIKVLKVFIQNIKIDPLHYCQLWNTISTLKDLEFVYVSLQEYDLNSFNAFKQAILSLPKINQLYLTSHEFKSIDRPQFCDFIDSLKAKSLKKIIFNLYEISWFGRPALESIRSFILQSSIRNLDLNFASLSIDNGVFNSFGQKFKQNKDLSSFGLSLINCDIDHSTIEGFMENLTLSKDNIKSFDLTLPGLKKSSRLSLIFKNLSLLSSLKELSLDLSNIHREDTRWLVTLKEALGSLKSLKALALDLSRIPCTQNFLIRLGEILENLGGLVSFTLDLEKEFIELGKLIPENSKDFLYILLAKLRHLKKVRNLCLNLRGWEGELGLNSTLFITSLRSLNHLQRVDTYVSFMFNGESLTKFMTQFEKSLPKVSLFLTDRT